MIDKREAPTKRSSSSDSLSFVFGRTAWSTEESVMEDFNVQSDEQILSEELEPIEIAAISEVTGAAVHDDGDERGQYVWGNL